MPLGISQINTRQYKRVAKVITNGGGATISSTQSKFGGTSMAVSVSAGTSSHYISIPSSSDLNFGSNNFTWECWIYPTTLGGTASSAGYFIDNKSTGTGGIDRIGISSQSSTIVVNAFNTTNLITSSGVTIAINTWYHIALVRSGNTLTLYIDGTSRGTGSATGQSLAAATTYIGKGSSNTYTAQYFRGYIDEVRISNIARYTTTFTPSTTRFQNDGNTVFLLHADGINGATTFSEDCGTG